MWGHREKMAVCKPRGASSGESLTPQPWISSLQNCEEINIRCVRPPTCVHCYGSPRQANIPGPWLPWSWHTHPHPSFGSTPEKCISCYNIGLCSHTSIRSSSVVNWAGQWPTELIHSWAVLRLMHTGLLKNKVQEAIWHFGKSPSSESGRSGSNPNRSTHCMRKQIKFLTVSFSVKLE